VTDTRHAPGHAAGGPATSTVALVLAILGGLGAACAWAISTLCSSRSSRLMAPPGVVAWVMLVGAVICVPLAALSGAPPHVRTGAVAWLVLSGAGNVAGLLTLYAALRIGQVALLAPIVSTEGAVAAALALATGERLRTATGIGLAIAMIGLCLAAAPPAAESQGRRHWRPAAVALALGAALLFGSSLYATARAGGQLPSAWVVLSARAIGTLTLVPARLAADRLRLPRRAAGLVLASGVCEVLGFFAFTAGSRHGIAVAAVLASQVGALAALAGYALFGERLARRQVVGVGTVLAGVALLSAVPG
jgi:drug/metabolite transporter (DMT)-like permease